VTAIIRTLNKLGHETVRSSDDELHKAARKYLLETGYTLFGNLPAVMRQIIEHEVWKSRPAGFKTFADYALAQTSDGLNINNNQRLWMLRCALDVTGSHVKEWTEVLAQVDEMVRLYAATEGSKISEFKGKQLATLSKNGEDTLSNKITYLPSGGGGTNPDRMLLRLRNTRPDLYRRVVVGKLKLTDAARQAGVSNYDAVAKATSIVKRMTPKDRKRFIDWLRLEKLI
jgi:hypothetical protein